MLQRVLRWELFWDTVPAHLNKLGLNQFFVEIFGNMLCGFDSRAAQKCWAQMEFVNIYQFRFHPMFKYACVCCVRFVLNLIYSIVVNLGAGL